MAASKKASLGRHQLLIYGALFAGYALYAYNRKSVSLALPKLIEEGMDKKSAGLIISSQNVAYAVSKFLGGVLSDRVSSRLLFSVGLLMSGSATLLFASASSVTAFASFWFLNGFAQGCGWPACAKMLRKWFEPSRFGTYWSLLSASANVSGGAAPFISAYLVATHGWRVSLSVAGVTSLAMGVVSLVYLIDTPEQAGFDGFSKDQPTAASKTTKAGSEGGSTRDLVQSPFLWLVSFCYMVVFCAKTSAVDWGQLYLIEDRKHSGYVASAFTSSVESGGFLGGVLAGYLTDWVLKRRAAQGESGDRSSPRMPVAMLFMTGVMTCLHLLRFNVHQDSSQVWIATVGFLLGACLYGPIAIFGVVATESAPDHQSGTAHAVVALAANVGAVSSGLPFSILASTFSWGAVFLLLEFLCAGTALLMILASKMEARIGRPKRD